MQIRITVPEDANSKLRSELLSDWNHFQESGLHLIGHEVDVWLEELIVNLSAELPALHR